MRAMIFRTNIFALFICGIYIAGIGACGKTSDENKAPGIEISATRTDQTVKFLIKVTPNGKMDPIKTAVVYASIDGTEPSDESLKLAVDLTSQIVVGSHYEFQTVDSVSISSSEQVIMNFRTIFTMDHRQIKINSLGQEEAQQVDLRVASLVMSGTYTAATDTPSDSSPTSGTATPESPVASTPAVPATPAPQFVSGQPASTVIGQSSFTANSIGYDEFGFKRPGGIHLTSSGILYVADTQNNRIEGFSTVPTANGAAASFTIGGTFLGDNSFGSGAVDKFNNPQGIATTSTQLFVADTYNARVQLFNSPTLTGASANLVMGQSTPSANTAPASASATVMSGPAGVSVGGSKVAIANSSYSRILLYNSIPTSNSAAADVVLGQINKTSSTAGSGATMSYPHSVWTDGTKVIATDNYNHRVLIWNSWPTTDGQTPDIILGQATINDNASSFGAPTASTVHQPAGVTSDGTQIVIADQGTNRVLIWKTWPTSNKQPADIVLGQADFTSAGTGSTATTFDGPSAVAMDSTRIFVTDTFNNRVLIFKKQ